MQANPYPTWKTILKGIPWLIGILLYGLLVILASVPTLSRIGGIDGDNILFAGGLWIVLLALPAVAASVSGHKTAASILGGMALMLVVLFTSVALVIFAFRGYSGDLILGGP